MVSKNELALQAKANELFRRAMQQRRQNEKGICEQGCLLAKLRADGLWKHITDSKGVPRFRQWTEVAECVIGPKAHRTYYELIACHSLTEGENPIPAEKVKRMGINRAAEVARLDPEERTPEIVEAATRETVTKVRNLVQGRLNESLPPDQRKEALRLFAINLPESIASELEQLIEQMCYMQGLRDGDATLSLRGKAIAAIILAARERYADELQESEQCRMAQEGIDACAAEEEEEEMSDVESDVPEPEEIANRAHASGRH